MLASRGDSRPISRAIQKLGVQNFQITTVATAKTLDDARKRAKQYVSMTHADTDGYNGFDDIEIMVAKQETSQESRRKIGLKRKNQKHLDKTKKQISMNRKGKSMGQDNSMSSEAARAKVGLSKVGRKKRWNADGTYSYVFPENRAENAS